MWYWIRDENDFKYEVKNFILFIALYFTILRWLLLSFIEFYLKRYYYFSAIYMCVLTYACIYISFILACSRIGSSVKRWKQIVWNNSWREVSCNKEKKKRERKNDLSHVRSPRMTNLELSLDRYRKNNRIWIFIYGKRRHLHLLTNSVMII